MRHRKLKGRLSRTSSHRINMFKNMTSALLEHERIITTVPKAKELRKYADKMITLAKREDLHARRQAYSFIPHKHVVRKLFESIGPRFLDRNGGYTRIYKLGFRRGDAAPMAVIELVSLSEKVQSKKDDKKTKKKGIQKKLEEFRRK
ncbi:50S ribosomal protein L17 [candidate division CSSED10-310 bacterium]|uniref:Large ribosomal subunit protein bL17 n=1 Tax=candidate division CSSED10-310 bacterium TaxID=2855610 RepID=A0ABV6YYW6_UNCC1